MKLNFSYPATGCQKLIEIDDERKVRVFYDKRMGQEVELDSIGDEFKGYVAKIGGGNDKQGFPMKQGVLTNTRVRLLLSKGHSCYRPRRDGERKRKSVRGCIVDSNLSVIALIVVQKGEKEIPGLTDQTVPRRLGPKRANNIRKLFNLTKEDDVRQYVVKRPIAPREGKDTGKPKFKAPKIQRLITPSVLQRKRRRMAQKRARAVNRREQAAEYARLLAQRQKEMKERRHSRRRTTTGGKSDRKSESSDKAAPEKKVTVSGDKKAQAKPDKKAQVAKALGDKKKQTAGGKSGKLEKKPSSGKPSATKPAGKPSATGKAAAAAVAKKASKPSASAPAKKSSKPSAAAPAAAAVPKAAKAAKAPAKGDAKKPVKKATGAKPTKKPAKPSK